MERIGGAIERELARSGSRDALPLAELTSAWPELVGETVARNAWPLRIGRDGTLHVAASSSTWAFELDRLGGEILDRIRARLGASAPAKLRFAVGPVPEPATLPEQPTSGSPQPPVDVPPEVASEAASAANAIEDEELRELVARAARASLVRARSDRGFW